MEMQQYVRKNKRFNMNLRDYLHFNKMTSEHMAQMLGLHGNTIRYISAGAREPSWKLAVKIELLTGGSVTREELKPGYDWSKHEKKSRRVTAPTNNVF